MAAACHPAATNRSTMCSHCLRKFQRRHRQCRLNPPLQLLRLLPRLKNRPSSVRQRSSSGSSTPRPFSSKRMRQQRWLSSAAGSRMGESGRMPVAGLELWLRLHRLQTRATLPSNKKLSMLLEGLRTSTPKTSLLQLLLGRYLF